MHIKTKGKKFDIRKVLFYTILTICVLTGEYYYIADRLKEQNDSKIELSQKFSKQFVKTSSVTGVVTNIISAYKTLGSNKIFKLLEEKMSKEYGFVDGIIYKEYEKDEKLIYKNIKVSNIVSKNIDLNKLNYNDSGLYILNNDDKNQLVIIYKLKNMDNLGEYIKIFVDMDEMVNETLNENEKKKYNLRLLCEDKTELWGYKVNLEKNFKSFDVKVRNGQYYLEIGYKNMFYLKDLAIDVIIVLAMFILYIVMSYIFFIITKKNKHIHELKEISLKLSKEVEKRKEVEEKYKLAIEASNDIIWEYDVKEKKLEFSDNWKILFDANQKKYVGDIFECLKGICDEEYYDILRVVIKQVSERKINNFKIELKGKYLNGQSKWIHMKGIVVVDDYNNIIKVGGAITDITENKNNEEKIKFLAYNDSLTELKNSKKFNEDLQKSINNSINKGVIGALLFLDLDDFKKVNDILGHDYGDRLLKEMATTLCRGVDKNANVYRIAGDEFAIIINDAKDISEIEKTAKNIVDSFKGGFNILGKYIMTSVSLGISIFPVDGLNAVEIFKNADTAMYKAKEEGKGKYRFFDKLICEEIIKKVDMESKIRKAIENKEFCVYYQPKINIKNNSIAGFEALIRWYSEEYKRWVSPMEFIPVAEEAGFISELGNLVLEEVCRQLNEWERKEIKVRKVAINISPIQLNKDNFKEGLFNLLSLYNVSPKSIEVEMTETAVMQNLEKNIGILKDLINNGVSIALDDFGTGYSSLSYLLNLPINILKIDRCFIRGLDEKKLNKGLVEAIVKLAHDINLKVVAEGVETESELEILKEIDCDIVQGYYFSKPISKGEVEEFIKQFL